MSIELKQAAQQALEALEEIALAGMSGTGQESEEGMRDWHARQAWKFIGIAARALDPLRTAIQQAEAQQPAAQDEQEANGLPPIVAGAVFDFAGFMTTRSKVIEVGSTAEAGPVADLVKEWAELRGLDLANAAVLSWQLHITRASLPATAEPVDWSEREQLRHAQAAVVMPMIGPLLDAWENSDREVMSQEPELSKQLKNINSAMEDADTRPAPSVLKDDQIAALVNKVRDIARMFNDHQSLRERIAIELVPALKVSQEVKSNAERGRFLIEWLKRYGLLQAEFGQMGVGEKPENWWLLHAPWGIDQTRPFLGHGKTPEQAIDAARLAAKEGGAL